jgi:hypothetical protein
MTFNATTRLVEVQAGGYGGDPTASDPSLLPQTIPGVPVAFPYGFLSLLPTGDAFEVEVFETAGGVLAVSTRSALPSGIPAPAEGDSMQYSSGGSYTHHDASGDTVHEPNSGKDIKLGKGATKAVALNNDECASSTTFDIWAAAVQTAITGLGGAVSPAWSNGDPIADIAASATKVKAE